MIELGEAASVYVSERRRNRSLAPSSLTAISNLLWRFTDYFGAERDPSTIIHAEVCEWAASIDVGPRTKLCYVSQAHGLFKWLLLRDMIVRDPFLGMQLPRSPDSIPRAFEPEAVGLILDHCADSRERLIVMLGVQEALRASEVAALETAHVSRNKGVVHVRGSKGGKDRNVPLTDETKRALTDYLAENPPLFAGPLIRSYVNPKRGIGSSRVTKSISAVMYRAGLKQRPRDGVSFHALRHTAASDVLESSGDLMAVKELLGHSSIATTQIYTRTVAAERLRAVVNGRTYRTAS